MTVKRMLAGIICSTICVLIGLNILLRDTSTHKGIPHNIGEMHEYEYRRPDEQLHTTESQAHKVTGLMKYSVRTTKATHKSATGIPKISGVTGNRNSETDPSFHDGTAENYGKYDIFTQKTEAQTLLFTGSAKNENSKTTDRTSPLRVKWYYKDGKICIEENICKTDTSHRAYTYIRQPDFYRLINKGMDVPKSSVNSGSVVPDIVHYTWYKTPTNSSLFSFHHMMAVLSAHMFHLPKKIYFWHDVVPTGQYWKEMTEKVPELFLVYRKAPVERFERGAAVAEHITDVVRLEAVMEYGGISLDMDVVVLKSFDPLLKYDVAMGYESPARLGTGVIMAKPWADFLRIWYKQHIPLSAARNVTYSSVELVTVLAEIYPNLIHTELSSMSGPKSEQFKILYTEGSRFNWSYNYILRLLSRYCSSKCSPQYIKHWNTTAGEIYRYIYYGHWQAVEIIEPEEKICMYGNICKYKDSENIWRYRKQSTFLDKIDAKFSLNINILHNENVVPNIVHFTWYGGTSKGNTFRFHHLIAVLAAHKYIQPEVILFWHEMVPEGPYWTEANKKVPEIQLVHRLAPTEIRGKKVALAEHLSDIVRLEALIEYGGIYLDLDAIVVKPFETFRKYDVTMGYELHNGLCNAIIISKPWAEFLRIWHSEYKTFDDKEWAYHSVNLPAKLAREYSMLIHTESTSMHRPSWQEVAMLYEPGKLYDWRTKNYAVHLWIRHHRVEHNSTDIKTWNTTAGEIFRYIYFNDWRIWTNLTLQH